MLPPCALQFTTVDAELVAFERMEAEVSSEGGLSIANGVLYRLERAADGWSWSTVADLPELRGEEVVNVFPVGGDIVVVTRTSLLRYRLSPLPERISRFVVAKRVRGASMTSGFVVAEGERNRVVVYDPESNRLLRFGRIGLGTLVLDADPGHLLLGVGSTLMTKSRTRLESPDYVMLGGVGPTPQVSFRNSIEGRCGDWVIDRGGALYWPSIQAENLQPAAAPAVPGLPTPWCGWDRSYEPSPALSETTACIVHADDKIYRVDRQGESTAVPIVDIPQLPRSK